MKKNLVIRTILTAMVIACLLIGCGKAEAVSEVTQEEIKESEESLNEMQEAQSIITVTEITDVANYIEKLDPMLPHIIIWNEVEGYIVDIGEGECYHLKKEDNIYFIWDNEKVIGHATSIPQLSFENTELGYKPIPDYSKFESPLKVWYGIQLKETNTKGFIYIHCYLYPPAE